MKILLIDNYDSFTYNLYHYISNFKKNVEVVRNDKIDGKTILRKKYNKIVISPGPGNPNQAGNCLKIVKEIHKKIPILGVCLGHQTIAQAFGGDIIRCHEIIHGKMGEIHHDSTGLFEGIPEPFSATRYHSLIVSRENLPGDLKKTAWLKDGTIMGLSHKKLPIFGVQFHPESIASEHGHKLVKNFISNTGIKL